MITKDNIGLSKMMDDFAQPTETKEAPVLPPVLPPVAAAPPAAPNVPPVQEETEREYTDEEVESNADMMLGFIDVGQEEIFGWGLEKKKASKITKLYGENAKRDLENALAKKKQNENPNLTADELGLIGIHENAEDILKNFPFTDKEKERLRPHVEKWVRKNAGQIPDGFWAMAAIFGIFGGRLINITQL